MARIPKGKKVKERRPKNDIYNVPMLALKIWPDDTVRCDHCEQEINDMEDMDALICMGVTEHGTLAFARFHAPCIEKVEFGRAFCPGGLGAPALPLGAA